MTTASGVATVSSAGTAVPLGDLEINGPIAISAPEGNTGVMYVGNVDGDVASTNGYEMIAGSRVELDFIGNLSQLFVDAATGGDKVTWIRLNFRPVS